VLAINMKIRIDKELKPFVSVGNNSMKVLIYKQK